MASLNLLLGSLAPSFALQTPQRAPSRSGSVLASVPGFTPLLDLSAEALRAAPLPPASSEHDILLRCARGETVERTPVWLMRQAGRYMKSFREFSETIPFRERSETAEIAIELSLQPWKAFNTDGVIMFSDILTPLPAMGIDFDVVKGKVREVI